MEYGKDRSRKVVVLVTFFGRYITYLLRYKMAWIFFCNLTTKISTIISLPPYHYTFVCIFRQFCTKHWKIFTIIYVEKGGGCNSHHKSTFDSANNFVWREKVYLYLTYLTATNRTQRTQPITRNSHKWLRNVT